MKLNNLLFLILLNIGLAGCGQPGPLYLPGSVAPIHVQPELPPKSEPKPEKNK